MNKRRFGVWGEAAVARAFRDRGYETKTEEGGNIIPFRDIIVRKEKLDVDVQVRATEGKPGQEFYRAHYRQLMELVEGAKERQAKWLLTVANLSFGTIYLFTGRYVRESCEEAKRDLGSRATFPGMVMLEFDYAWNKWALTTGEIAAGKRILDQQQSLPLPGHADLC
jgi:hypothetical protein